MAQFLIEFDQLINTVVYIKGDGIDYADETLSARRGDLEICRYYPIGLLTICSFGSRVRSILH